MERTRCSGGGGGSPGLLGARPWRGQGYGGGLVSGGCNKPPHMGVTGVEECWNYIIVLVEEPLKTMESNC